MIDQNKNKGTDDIDDDAFDVEDFADADFDEAVYDEDVLANDENYADEDFFEEEWQDQEKPAPKKGRSSSPRGDKKGLSFNTAVILGAVVLGVGVLLINIKNKSSEVQAPKQSVFRSVLGIGEIMDGGLFGKNEETATPEDQANAASAAKPEEGFLNDPETVTAAPPQGTTDQNPPAPTPIAPSETQVDNEPLTPMPDVTEIPRGPEQTEETVAASPLAKDAVESTSEPVAAAPSAKDILEQALSNREKKTQEESKPVAAEASPAPVVREQEKPVEEPVPVAAQPSIPAPSPKEDAAVQVLEEKIDLLLKRMDQIEDELGNVRENKQDGYEQMAQSVQTLKKDIAAIKDRPVVPQESSSAGRADEEQPKSEVKKKNVEKSSKTVREPERYPTPAISPGMVSNQWELRAAQPGRAWVSRLGSRDMQSVVVGDVLPGLGRVTNIFYQEGRWTVQGDQGHIRQ